ncbi:Ribosomal RNA-processing protein 8 [Toxocara canis]|uniref:Ribosomal RNA-processing protein 8 n=1 Tax=Toxocara canis TaxID=6265 RepID=A0A0B2UXG7_TOXCA|nr:Ribosomal RNA-processing protein 8 [Toxocara canis]
MCGEVKVKHRKRKAVNGTETEENPKKARDYSALEKVSANGAEDGRSPTLLKRVRRPWRNRVRKKAAKEAARIRREKQETEEAKVKGTLDTEAAAEGKKKKKRKKKKKKSAAVDGMPTTSHEGSEITKARKRLSSARFRFINEQLYTSSGEEAMNMFQQDPQAFRTYHDGYRSQMKKWPFNPVNGIIQWLRTMIDSREGLVVADMGCGEAKISEVLSRFITVHSFDFIALNERITACNMAKVPLEKETVDVAVFCLSLMGTNLNEYLREANRILKMGFMQKILGNPKAQHFSQELLSMVR